MLGGRKFCRFPSFFVKVIANCKPMWYNELYMNFCGEELLEWITALSNLPFTIIPIFTR